MAYTDTTTVFWPLEEPETDGIAYGWSIPGRICVAGVLKEGSRLGDAQRRLDRLAWSERCKPTVLTEVDLAAHPRIYYNRYPSQSLRFYKLEDSRRRPTTGLDHSLIQQFNQAHQVYSIVNERPIRLHKPTAGVLLNVAATLIRPVLSISRHGQIPFLSHLLPHFALAQQLKVRGRQAEAFLTNIDALSVGRDDTYIPRYAHRYTSFFNDIWLILNDYTIGFGFGALLCENHDWIAALLVSRIRLHCLSQIEASLVWLDSWPGGLKLNTELSKFYSKVFISIIQLWGDLLVRHILPYTPFAILYCGYASMIGGFTVAISAMLDLMGFFITPHLTVCYMLSRVVYSIVKGALGGLWGVFRGKRHNVLRNRMDTWDFDIDQLVFGTMLFTLLVFLFPTILGYYLMFASVHLVLLLQHAAIEALLAFMNHFPLFKLMLKVKDPSRLPVSVCLKISTDCLIIVQNQPKALMTIFDQYAYLWQELAKHYNPLILITSIISGKYLIAMAYSRV